MFKWFKRLFKIRDYRLSPEDYEKWKKEVADPAANKENEVYLQEMASTYCPIAKTNCLLDNCLHFQKAWVNYRNGDNMYGYDPFYWIEKPECKLWRKD